MKHRILTITALLLTITFCAIAQEQVQLRFGLPEGVIARLGNGELGQVKYSPDGMQLAVATSIGTWIYDTTTWQPIHLLTDNTTHINDLIYHPTKNTLAISDDMKGVISLWNADEGKHIRNYLFYLTSRIWHSTVMGRGLYSRHFSEKST